jgi:hypothetical protein
VSSFLVDGAGAPYDGEWYDTRSSSMSTDTIAWGEGFWLVSRAGTEDIWVEGELAGVDFNANIPVSGQVLLGQPYPVSRAMNVGAADNINYAVSGGTMGADSAAADSLCLRACGASYRINFLGMDGQLYDDATGLPTAEGLDPREGFWIKRGTNPGFGIVWTYPKPYAQPPN